LPVSIKAVSLTTRENNAVKTARNNRLEVLRGSSDAALKWASNQLTNSHRMTPMIAPLGLVIVAQNHCFSSNGAPWL